MLLSGIAEDGSIQMVSIAGHGNLIAAMVGRNVVLERKAELDLVLASAKLGFVV